MDYKILEANGVEIENIDGGAFNNFTAGGQSGVIAGVLDECKIISKGSNLVMTSGLLLIKGVRVKLLSNTDFVLNGIPAVITNYHLVARVVLSEDRSITFEMLVRPISTLQQDDLYVADKGTFELEICRFIHNTNGSIENIVISVQKLEGKIGSGGSGGTTDYNDLNNKPKINGKELVGDLSSDDLGIVDDNTIQLFKHIFTIDLEKNPDAFINTIEIITTSNEPSIIEISGIKVKGCIVAINEGINIDYALCVIAFGTKVSEFTYVSEVNRVSVSYYTKELTETIEAIGSNGTSVITLPQAESLEF